jgi:hypothetical protein
MPTIFVSHSSLSSAKEKAIDFKRLLLDGSSDLRFFNVTCGNQIPLDEGLGGNETTDAASGVNLIKGLRGRLF